MNRYKDSAAVVIHRFKYGNVVFVAIGEQLNYFKILEEMKEGSTYNYIENLKFNIS